MHDFDPNTGIIFYTQVGINGFGCWNTNTPHRPENVAVLAKNNQTMIYPSDLTVSHGQFNCVAIKCNCYTIQLFQIDRDGDVWIMTNRLPIFVYSQLNPNEYNFRLWRVSTRDSIVSNSICQNPRRG